MIALYHAWEVAASVGCKEASQTRYYCVTKSATHCAARPDSLDKLGTGSSLRTKTLAQDDNQISFRVGDQGNEANEVTERNDGMAVTHADEVELLGVGRTDGNNHASTFAELGE